MLDKLFNGRRKEETFWPNPLTIPAANFFLKGLCFTIKKQTVWGSGEGFCLFCSRAFKEKTREVKVQMHP